METSFASDSNSISGDILNVGEFHKPVLLVEAINWIEPKGDGVYLDGTVGGGGHSKLLLDTCETCRVIAVDQDSQALSIAKRVLKSYRDRTSFVHARFDQALDHFSLQGLLSGAFLDLGVSSRQLDDDARGFTFRKNVNLDMRMDCANSKLPTAAQVLNEASEEKLEKIFRDYGEEPKARKLAHGIVSRRRNNPFLTSDDLVAILYKTFRRIPKNKEKARIFQVHPDSLKTSTKAT